MAIPYFMTEQLLTCQKTARYIWHDSLKYRHPPGCGGRTPSGLKKTVFLKARPSEFYGV